ncbi:MAG: efflux RND transporter periplasmic adaptor subunit [Planctomycetota bacterium]
MPVIKAIQPAKKRNVLESGVDPHVEIRQLAQSLTSRHAFFMAVLKVIGRTFASPYASIYISSGIDVTEDEYSDGSTDPSFWKTQVQMFLTESMESAAAGSRLFRPKDGSAPIAFLSAPFFDMAGSIIGAVAVVVVSVDETRVTRLLARLESLNSIASHMADMVASDSTHGGSSHAEGEARMATHGADRARTPEELAFAVTNSLRNHLGCEQVSLGRVQPGKRIRILSISGLDHVTKGNPGVIPIKAAMEECMDVGKTIISQAKKDYSDESMNSGYRLHMQWRQIIGGDAVASIPIIRDEKPFAVVSIRRRSDQIFFQEDIKEIQERVSSIAPLMLLSEKATRGLLRHAWDSLMGRSYAHEVPRKIRAPLLVLFLVSLLAWFIMGTLDYRLVIPCKVNPATVKHVAMPFEGVITQANMTLGDPVEKGQVLCMLDTRNLIEEQSGLSAELAVLEHDTDRALAENEPVNVQLNRAKRSQVEARLAILENRIQRATVRAPAGGVILSGDVDKRVGSVLALGAPLYEIAPLDHLVLDIQIPEADVDEVSPAMLGYFAPYARPEQRNALSITRILPSAEVVGGRNAYRAEAHAEFTSEWIRPGMEGSAVIELGPRPVWWVVSHRAIDYIRYKLLP